MTKIQVVDEVGESVASESSRRAFLKRAAVVAWSTPLIMTVTANRALATHQGCVHAGDACTGTVTTPVGTCCPTAFTGHQQVCCATGTTQAGTCQRAIGQPCTNNNQCCNVCTPANVCA